MGSIRSMAMCLVALFIAPAAFAQNILLVVGDDIGVDNVGVYQAGPDLPNTPIIDALASTGVLYRQAWAHPLCTPSRASIQTGLLPFRTELGSSPIPGWNLATSFLTIPEALDQLGLGYTSATFGKWHLNDDPFGPNLAGYAHFAGVKANLGTDPTAYFAWDKIVNGVEFSTTGYITTDTADDAIDWIKTAPEPWFCQVSFNAPHAPLHVPPPSLHSVDLASAGPIASDPRPYYRAMVEAMDTEIGRLLANLEGARDRTTVIFIGDNGTSDLVISPPLDPTHSKGTAFEGGVNVPLIVDGPVVVEGGRESRALVQFTDLFATIVDIATSGTLSMGPPPVSTTLGAPVQSPVVPLPFALPEDSISFWSTLRFPAARGSRNFGWAEYFVPNGPQPEKLRRAVRDRRYKVITNIGQLDPPLPEGVFMYDLYDDPFETVNLFDAPLTPEAMSAFLVLRSYLIDTLP